MKFIDERINIIKSKSGSTLNDAMIELTTMGSASIPEKKKCEIILAALDVKYNKYPEEFYLLLQYITPPSLKDIVINKLLDDLDSNKTDRRDELITATGTLAINHTEEMLSDVLNEFMNFYKTHPFRDGSSLYYILKIFCSANIPNEMKADLKFLLIESIDSVKPHQTDLLAQAIVNTGISKEEFYPILNKLKDRILASHYSDREPYIYAAFSKADIPVELRSKFIDELIQRIDHDDVTNALSEMNLTHSECEKIVPVLLKTLSGSENNNLADSMKQMETLIKLQRFMLPHESVAIKIKLEEIMQSASKNTSLAIMSHMKEFDKLCSVKMMLSQKLPTDIISIISRS
jgi:hypothetical protein